MVDHYRCSNPVAAFELSRRLDAMRWKMPQSIAAACAFRSIRTKSSGTSAVLPAAFTARIAER
jgi:hypothetical protein